MDKSNKDELIKIVILGIIIVILIVISIIIHKSKLDFGKNENNININTNDFPIENMDSNKIKLIDDVNGIFYYDNEDYDDFQDD